MIIKPFDKNTDYDTIVNWWKDHNWTPVPIDALPLIGYIVGNGNIQYCAGFLYQTDSSFSIMEFIISNKHIDRDIKNIALDLLIDTLVKSSENLGYKYIHTSVQHPKLMKRYEQHGFIATDSNMTNYLRRVV